MLDTILLVVAFLAFVVAAVNPTWGRVQLVAVGLALWVLAILVGDVNISAD